jgi:hypothetical protein
LKCSFVQLSLDIAPDALPVPHQSLVLDEYRETLIDVLDRGLRGDETASFECGMRTACGGGVMVLLKPNSPLFYVSVNASIHPASHRCTLPAL